VTRLVQAIGLCLVALVVLSATSPALARLFGDAVPLEIARSSHLLE
jgi:hypothetical protein